MTSHDVGDPAVAGVLDRLHHAARSDWRQALLVLPRVLYGRITGRSLTRSITPSQVKGMYLPISRRYGQLLYAVARGAGARQVVEFGTSFGISTLYLAAAVRGNGGGRVVTTEIEPSKCEVAEANIRQAGLDDVAEVWRGDALHTLNDVEGPVDLVFLDGWQNLYLPVLELLIPKLRRGALVVADNANFADARPYFAHVRGSAEFVSALLPGGRMEWSWYLP